MKMGLIAAGAALAVLLGLGACSANAQSLGEEEYMTTCASCHGASGVGDGPMAQLMTVPLPDLTQISANNDGQFPMLQVIQIIDGRTGVRGHGYPMPIWGARFQAEAREYVGLYGSEMITRGRILILAEYLESIQQ